MNCSLQSTVDVLDILDKDDEVVEEWDLGTKRLDKQFPRLPHKLIVVVVRAIVWMEELAKSHWIEHTLLAHVKLTLKVNNNLWYIYREKNI